jgi:hypothetical protein
MSAYGPYASVRTGTHNWIAPYCELAGTPWERDPQPPRLFRLDEHLCEREDVTQDEPAIAQSLRERLDHIMHDGSA